MLPFSVTASAFTITMQLLREHRFQFDVVATQLSKQRRTTRPVTETQCRERLMQLKLREQKGQKDRKGRGNIKQNQRAVAESVHPVIRTSVEGSSSSQVASESPVLPAPSSAPKSSSLQPSWTNHAVFRGIPSGAPLLTPSDASVTTSVVYSSLWAPWALDCG